jgi:aerobic-type carbon monoxide dehydrogenase small subunit (CoxS/CutS family)
LKLASLAKLIAFPWRRLQNTAIGSFLKRSSFRSTAMLREMTLHVNGKEQKLSADPERPLLDVLREDLALTGAKYGCGEGECGCCTVLVDGKPTRSCITTVGEVGVKKIATIESLASADGKLHPVQSAFIEKQGLQCGYCVPGQIMTAVALLAEKPKATRDEIVSAMTGNMCRCCNYPNILAAVVHAAQG